MIRPYEIGTRFKEACHLATRPIYITVADNIPKECSPLTTIDRCIAKALLKMALVTDTPPVYLNADQADKACGGGMQWSGFCEANPMIKYFVSTGHKDFRNGIAEYLRATPEIADEAARKAGHFSPPGKYLLFYPFDKITAKSGKMLAITCFGTAEQIRNLATLVHFRNVDIFQNVVMAVGPACSTLVSYPAGIAENAPKKSAFIGPADPTGNAWFPPDFMALGIPIALASQMAEDLGASFLAKRSQVAFPPSRIKLDAERPKK
nr:DUF169 domain-containing protein [Candidatus Sigynarchaeota archaeon]